MDFIEKNVNISLREQGFYFDSAIISKEKYSGQHWHDCFEFYYLESGICTIQIEDTQYNMNAKDMYFLPPHSIHNTTYLSASHSRLVLCIANDYIPDYIHLLINERIPVFRNPLTTGQVCSLFKKIENEHSIHDIYSAEAIKNYVRMLIILLLRNQNYYTNEITSGHLYVERITKYIDQNFASDITLTQTAQEHNITSEHLSRIFKTATGMTFHEYLNNVRLKQSAELLLQNDKTSISEVAHCCGFHDSNYFSTKFKDIYGMTPLQFRKSQL